MNDLIRNTKDLITPAAGTRGEKNGITFRSSRLWLAARAQGSLDKRCNLTSSLHSGIGIEDRDRTSAGVGRPIIRLDSTSLLSIKVFRAGYPQSRHGTCCPTSEAPESSLLMIGLKKQGWRISEYCPGFWRAFLQAEEQTNPACHALLLYAM